MNLVYLSAHFPAQYCHFVWCLAARGVKVLGITDQWDSELRPELRGALAAHFRVDSLQSREDVFNACDHFREKFGGIDRVESHLESWLELEAEIRERYQVPGVRPADLAFSRRKSVMKQVFVEAGVPVASGEVVESQERAVKFVGGRYPVFIKPDSGVGAADTYTIHDQSELENFFCVKKEYPYFIEEHLSGVIESFDGLTDGDGRIVFFACHRFSDDIHTVVTRNKNLFYYSLRDIPLDLEEAGKTTVRALGLREKFFHIKFFRLSNGDLRGLEINLRPPGGLTTHMFNYAADIDVYDWWASIVVGGSPERPYGRRFHCAYIGRKYDRPYEISHEVICRRFGHAIMLSQEMNPMEYPVLGKVGYVVRTQSHSELMSMIDLILAERS